MARDGTKDEALALALAAGASAAEAAKSVRLSVRTVKRRRADPAFMRRVAELRAEMVSRAVGRLSEAMTAAALQLRRLVLKGRSEQVQLGACRAVLELGNRLRESVELEQRLSALEEVMNTEGKRR